MTHFRLERKHVIHVCENAKIDMISYRSSCYSRTEVYAKRIEYLKGVRTVLLVLSVNCPEVLQWFDEEMENQKLLEE